VSVLFLVWIGIVRMKGRLRPSEAVLAKNRSICAVFLFFLTFCLQIWNKRSYCSVSFGLMMRHALFLRPIFRCSINDVTPVLFRTVGKF
jgi:hypothetical protein